MRILKVEEAFVKHPSLVFALFGSAMIVPALADTFLTFIGR
jgi:ABC-type phosphate transport system permease subunit